MVRVELTLLERREIARRTVPVMKRTKGGKFQGWSLLLAMGHWRATYDHFNIPKFEDEVDEYYNNNNNPIVPKYLPNNGRM